MRVGTGAAGVALLALAFAASQADAQTSARPRALASRPLALTDRGPMAATPSIATSSLAMDGSAEPVDVALGNAQDDDDDQPSSMGMVPSFGGLSFGRAVMATRGLARRAHALRPWATAHGLRLSDEWTRTLAMRAAAAAADAEAYGWSSDADGQLADGALGVALGASSTAGDAGLAGSIENTPVAYESAMASASVSDLPSAMAIGRGSDTFGLESFVADVVDPSDVVAAALPSLLPGFDDVVGPAAETVTPEPASLVLIGSGVVALGLVGRRRRIF